jgi:hypothetical protein
LRKSQLSQYPSTRSFTGVFAVALVSTADQNHASQMEQLTATGAVKVFSEKASGKDADRCQDV